MCQPELALTRIKRDDSKAEGYTRDRESYCKCFLVPSVEESVSGSEDKTLISNKSQSVVSIRASNSKMLEGKALVEDTDMPLKMQIQAMSCASQALDLYDVLDCESIAAHIKKDFDSRYGGGWQCVVGSKFGCFFTHAKGTFIYFKLERLNFLIFKGASSPTCR